VCTHICVSNQLVTLPSKTNHIYDQRLRKLQPISQRFHDLEPKLSGYIKQSGKLRQATLLVLSFICHTQPGKSVESPLRSENNVLSPVENHE